MSDDLPTVLPERRTDVLVADFGSEYVVLDPVNALVHHFAGGLAAVFNACDGVTTSAELLAEARDAGVPDLDEFRGFMGEALDFLAGFGLLVGTHLVTADARIDDGERDEPPPCLGCGKATNDRRWFPRRRRGGT
jgi:hypothetical protein